MRNDDRLLRYTLQANGCFSLLSSAMILSFAGPLADWMGIPDPLWVWALGPGLLIFGAVVLGLGMRPAVSGSSARLVIWLDGAWVAGSVLLLGTFGSGLTIAGIWVVADTALVVGVFASLQWIGLSRAERAGRLARS